jgi:formate hydrogenlyase subunit 3/multisubunit Na+/H+ antiporter MnhD subunit
MPVLFMDIPWPVLLVLLPLIGGISCFLFPKIIKILGILSVASVTLAVVGLAMQIQMLGVLHYPVGGWGAPLGIELYADGLSLLMLAMTASVALAVSIYSTGYFNDQQQHRFWPLWLFLLAALNALFLSADIFNLYVTLELMGLSAVALAALSGTSAAIGGAMRYLLSTMLGSLLYLLGVALLYHSYATVDISILSERITSTPIVWTATGLITAGLALKTALFPLHFWLPPAHASAPAPVSAVLSALVVKASFYILLRLWLEIFGQVSEAAESLLGLLGAMAILWGSIQALRQNRVKLLVAYSTVAQIGYLFLAFPLASTAGLNPWHAIIYLALSHALAKSAMFMAAGNLLRFGGHDRIAELDRVVQRLPLTVAAFALAGVSIMGLPPSGGFIGKWLLLQSALSQGRWELVAVMILGGLLAAGYVFKVLGCAFTQAEVTHEAKSVPASMEWSALLLASAAIVIGFTAMDIFNLVEIGTPFENDGVKR